MEKAVAAPLKLRPMKPKDKVAAYFVEHVRRYVQEKYGADVLYKEGLSIYTTLNLSAQKDARDAVEKGLAELEDTGKISTRSCSGRALLHGCKNRRYSRDGRRARFQ